MSSFQELFSLFAKSPRDKFPSLYEDLGNLEEIVLKDRRAEGRLGVSRTDRQHATQILEKLVLALKRDIQIEEEEELNQRWAERKRKALASIQEGLAIKHPGIDPVDKKIIARDLRKAVEEYCHPNTEFMMLLMDNVVADFKRSGTI